MSRAQYAQEVYSRFLKPRKLRQVFVPVLDRVWTSDQTGPISGSGAYKYITVYMDIFSRYLWAVPARSITAAATWSAFQQIMESSGRKPQSLWVDQGTSYLGAGFQGPANRDGITLYSTMGQHKAAMAERVIQTITNQLWREMTAADTQDWASLLPDVVARYNSTRHRSIGMTPDKASDPENAVAVFENQYGRRKRARAPMYRKGEWVRIARNKDTFEKGRSERWSTELYRVAAVDNRAPPTMYTLEDALGDPIRGRFYAAELLPSVFTSESQRELLFPRRDPATAGPDEVAEVLGYRVDEKNTSKYGKYLITVRLGDGSTEEVPLQAYIGKVDKNGKFKATPRNPDQVLPPIGDWLERTLPDVYASI